MLEPDFCVHVRFIGSDVDSDGGAGAGVVGAGAGVVGAGAGVGVLLGSNVVLKLASTVLNAITSEFTVPLDVTARTCNR